MFKILEKKFNITPPWGILTGIRPVKIVHSLLDDNFSDEEIIEKLTRDYFINDDKINLALDIAKRAEVEDQYICLQAASTLSYLYYRYIENFKTKDYSQEDIKQICRKFYSYTFSFGLNNFLSAALASQKENFLERGLKEEDITSFPFDQFILDIK